MCAAIYDPNETNTACRLIWFLLLGCTHQKADGGRCLCLSFMLRLRNTRWPSLPFMTPTTCFPIEFPTACIVLQGKYRNLRILQLVQNYRELQLFLLAPGTVKRRQLPTLNAHVSRRLHHLTPLPATMCAMAAPLLGAQTKVNTNLEIQNL